MRKDVRKALRGRSLSFLGANREIRRIEEYLHDGEEVHDLMACKFGETGGRALIVVTDERVFVYKDGWIFKNSQGMGYSDIRTVEIRTGLFFAKIKFKGEGMSFETSKVGRFSAEHGVKIIRARIGSRFNTWESQRQALRSPSGQTSAVQPEATPLSAPPAKAPAFYETDEPLTLDQFLKPITGEAEVKPEKTSNLIDELERLQALLEKGVLNQEEYASAKKKLLS